MGNPGRFGKYGEQKRVDRLRQVMSRPSTSAVKGGRPASKPLHRGKQGHSNTRIAIRPAEVSDAEFIRDLSRKAFQQYGPYEALLPNWFLSGIGATMVAVLGRKIAGYAMLERIMGQAGSPRVSELLAIAVEPWGRNHGVGDRLLAETIRKARERHVERVVLHTAVDNLSGQALFRKHGFVACGIKTAFYPEGQDALVMEKELKPEAQARDLGAPGKPGESGWKRN
ncbi:MAG TPA: GNAT family N-acetyltransferase [Desulfobacteraceae bacterium]|nr:GNAT family N-acetyltransferase [Desulfobacteraceae bacterium]